MYVTNYNLDSLQASESRLFTLAPGGDASDSQASPSRYVTTTAIGSLQIAGTDNNEEFIQIDSGDNG